MSDILTMKTIVLTRQAAKDLDALPDDDRHAVTNALADYAVSGRGDVKALTGRSGYRMRIGTYRVLFDEDGATILAVYIGRRQTTTYRRN
jgi:mRNA interferase RelE/StbE